MNIIQKILKIKFLFLICLVLLTLFFPCLASAAGFWAGFINVIVYIPTILIAVFIAVAILISSLFFQLMGAILDWVISPGFVSLSYTRPCDSSGLLPAGCNPIIGMGLGITQSFVNLILVIFLVVIALSIALRLGEYGSKKIFVKLIIIALLVNFAPVLVGLIVDAANIVMNFFLKGIGESASGIWTQISTFGESAIQTLFSFRGEDLATKGGLLIQGITQVIINLGMAFAFLLFALLFLVRYVVIWTLVIFSPLAFVFWILPATKKLWDMWWNQLIQWSIIGIPIAFFLYLAMNSFAVLQQAFVSNLNLPGGVNLAGWFDKVFPFFVVIIFLILGFTIGLQTGAMGASSVISFGKSVPGRIAKTRIGAKALGGAAAGTEKVLGGVGKGLGWVEGRVGKIPGVGPVLKPIAGLALGGWMTRGINRLVGPKLLEYAAEKRRVSEADLDRIKGMSGAEAEAYTKLKAIGKTDIGQYAARMAENEQLEYSSPDFQKEVKAIRASIFEKENPYFQKEAHTLRKALGDMGRKELVHSKLVGITDKTERAKKVKEIMKEIRKTRNIIKERLKDEGITIEAGLKLKYITKEEVDKDKAKAVMTAKAKLTAEEITKFLTNTVAAATDVGEFIKPEDIKKMIDPDTLANRIGLTLGNPRNLQKIQDSFGHKKLKAVIEGRGGLNDATDTPEKLIEYARKINPAMARSILTSPAYRELDIKARKNMLDPLDRPTSSPVAFERRLRVGEIVEDNPTLQNARNLFKNINMTTMDLAKAKPAAEITAIRQQLESLRDRMSSVKDEFLTKYPEEKRRWEELERLMQLSEGRRR